MGDIELQTPNTQNPSKVRLLDAEVIHRIAAGEVVDRPASVLKELLDNAMDAHATRIKVQLVDGGLQLIEVDDNGWGMAAEDLEVCAQRHATSKIKSLEDLESIFTLGFRGEALSAVSSVSRLKIDTYRENGGGWQLDMVGGENKTVHPSPRYYPGTRVQVKDLFFNIPARKKFLKRSQSEAKECLEVLHSMSLAHPDIEIEYHFVSAAGEVVKQGHFVPSTLGERLSSVSAIDGEQLSLVETNPEPGIKKVEIAVFLPPISSHHQRIWLSVNGRPVVDRRLPYALREAFLGLIEQQAYPVGAIRLEVDPSLIDVNIHPQKREIRWPAGFSLAGHAYRWIRSALQKYSPRQAQAIPSFESIPNTAFDFDAPKRDLVPPSNLSPAAREEIVATFQAVQAAESSQPLTAAATDFKPFVFEAAKHPHQSPVPPFRFSSLRVVGEVGAAWLVAESEAGLILIDQHAAHERVQFERILKKGNLIRSRPLLLPTPIKLPFGLSSRDSNLIQALAEMGFELTDNPRSETEIEVVAVPEGDRKVDWAGELNDIFESLLRDTNVGSAADALRVKLASSLACHGSVRRGQRLKNDQITELFHSLDEIEWGGLCPHGRPLWFVLNHNQIEGFFHR